MSSTWEPARSLPPAGSSPLLCEGEAGPPCRGRPGVVGVRPPGGRLAVGRAPGPHLSSPPAPLLAGSASDAAPLQRSQSLPHAATVVLGGAPEPSALSSSALSEREASRLDKFKHLLAGPNTDLGESLWVSPGGGSPWVSPRVSPRDESLWVSPPGESRG